MRSPRRSSRGRGSAGSRSPTRSSRSRRLRRSTSRGRRSRSGVCRWASGSRRGRGGRTDAREKLQTSGDSERRQTVRDITDLGGESPGRVHIRPGQRLAAGCGVGLYEAVEVYRAR